jgi:DNA-binding transcriptional LysR family regulator
MISMLDPRLLQAFVAIAESGSFTDAAERLNLTQSTISQQLNRLEQAVGCELIDRSARPVGTSPSGERLLSYAHRILSLQEEAQALLSDPLGTIPIRIGVPDDIATSHMIETFAAFSKQHPQVRLDVATGLSRELARRYRNGEFDIVVLKELKASADRRASFAEPMAWFESVGNIVEWPDPVPLVTFPPGGLYREEMFAKIERESRHWYIAFTGSSLASILTAIEAGIGISLLPVISARGRAVQQYAPLGRGQPIAVSLYSWEATGPIKNLVTQMTNTLHKRAEIIPS